ncbi:DUF2182 domain-containing protein [Loktanella sp. IMCC34160]|uniref:DUF2182 domain-containing protein n=1 Tax=Loktanella sp. IMCC34160 TaxID=2510646 RepID=UPI00101DF326|nr:DUF2182 domain-containing protein [Loktanella sp. IMCC34160]RYG91880.1 DUF2182 domain-containing protein [Loktanella sp. IMCC34160]
MSDTSATLKRRLPRIGGAGFVWLGIYAAILLGWAGVVIMSRGLPGADLPAEIWESLCAAAAEADLGALFLMWALMVLAMMLPTAVPAFRTYDDLRQAGAGTTAGFVALVTGYGLVWLIGAGAGAVAQWALSRAGLLSPLGQSLSPWLTSGLLIVAGGYQFTRFKDACLSKCRMPMTFFMERWKPGARAALRMGVDLGIVCFGCCWALMLLAFVGGTMALWWMGLATLFMTFEKLPGLGRFLTRPAGIVLICAAPLPFVV